MPIACQNGGRKGEDFCWHGISKLLSWLMAGSASCLDRLQNGYEALADGIQVFVLHEQWHRALSILRQVGILSADGSIMRAVKNGMKLIANSPSAAKVAPTEIAREAQPDLAQWTMHVTLP